MSLTLGMTGMDPATETALRAAFGDANLRVGGRWSLVAETDADHVMVDMDSMYGPMSWLRLHAAGKRIIGLTTAPRTQTDFRLGRPFDSDAFAALLREIERDGGIVHVDAGDAFAPTTAPAVEAAAVPPARAAAAVANETPSAPPVDAAPAVAARAPAVDDVPASLPAAPAQSAASAETPPSAPVAAAARSTPSLPAIADATTPPSAPPPREPVALTPAPPSGSTHAPAPQDLLPEEAIAAASDDTAVPPEPDPLPPPAAPQAYTLADWLAPGALSQRVRYRRSAGPMLLIDPVARTYHGPSTLKPFTAYFRDTVTDSGFEPLDDAAWARDSAIAGAAQPLLRLQWLGAMVNGRAALGDDHAAGTRFKLTKWPQTEREFPKHFRIATAMMKGPATLAEIGDASTMPIDEVFEFVNANLVTGFAERVVDAPVDTAADVPRSGGLLGRFRAR